MKLPPTKIATIDKFSFKLDDGETSLKNLLHWNWLIETKLWLNDHWGSFQKCIFYYHQQTRWSTNPTLFVLRLFWIFIKKSRILSLKLALLKQKVKRFLCQFCLGKCILDWRLQSTGCLWWLTSSLSMCKSLIQTQTDNW